MGAMEGLTVLLSVVVSVSSICVVLLLELTTSSVFRDWAKRGEADALLCRPVVLPLLCQEGVPATGRREEQGNRSDGGGDDDDNNGDVGANALVKVRQSKQGSTNTLVMTMLR